MRKSLSLVLLLVGIPLLIFGGLFLFIMMSAPSGPSSKLMPELAKLDIPPQFKNSNSMQTAKLLFLTSCSKCHGNFAEGSLEAPNLTDAYWIHGQGRYTDIYEIIKNGLPGTTMMGWADKLQDEDIHRLAAYIVALKASHPPRAKPPQGQRVSSLK